MTSAGDESATYYKGRSPTPTTANFPIGKPLKYLASSRWRTARGFRNPRYSRFGNLRYRVSRCATLQVIHFCRIDRGNAIPA